MTHLWRHVSLRISALTAIALAAVLAATPAARADMLTGFAGFTTNGGAAISADNSTLSLTQGVPLIGQAGSAWSPGTQFIGGGFTARFTYNMTFQTGGDNPADGVAFVLQNDPNGTHALGLSGGRLGYTGITKSAAVEINVFSFSPGGPGTVLNTQGRTAQTGGSPYLPTTPVNLQSQDPIQITLTYDAATSTLTETLFDLTTSAMFTTSYVDNLVTEVGGPFALVGFTGATGAGTSNQSITSFTFDSPAAPEPASLTLLGIGTAGLLGYGWGRRRLAR